MNYITKIISILRQMKESPSDSNQKILYKISSKIILFLILILIYSYILWFVYSDIKNWNTPGNYSEEHKHIEFIDMFYYTSTTLFTVGFGDFTPKNKIVKVLTVLLMFIAYIVFTY